MSGSSEQAPPPTAGGAPDAAAIAEGFKDKGNAEYREGRFLKAAALYTQGLKADPGNAVLYRWGHGRAGQSKRNPQPGRRHPASCTVAQSLPSSSWS